MHPKLQALCDYCSERSSPHQVEPEPPDVPAEVTSGTIEITSILYLRSGAPPQRGHLTDQVPKPLKKVEQVFQRRETMYPVLLALTGSPRRAEMVERALVLQALCGQAFPSAATLGWGDSVSHTTYDRGITHTVDTHARLKWRAEKRWDRCLAWLRVHHLVRTWRLNRQGGQQSVNLIDLSPLWDEVRKLLTGRVGPVSRVGRRYWVKVSGFWVGAASVALAPARPLCRSGDLLPPLLPQSAG